MKRILTFGIMLMFLLMTITSANEIYLEKQSIKPVSFGNTLYVGGNGPGNYSKIQGAIDDANPGDTVFVYDDSSPYYENFQINKSINLIGEDRNTTVLNDDNSSENIIYIASNNVSIREFTIQNSKKYGIAISHSNFGTISDNIIIENLKAIWMVSSNNNIIKDNTFFDNIDFALDLNWCDYNTISGNTFSHSIVSYQGWGIGIISSRENNISGNLIKNNDEGFIIYESNNNIISYNNITSNADAGIEIRCSSNNRIIGNNISYNNIKGGDDKGAISFWENPCNNNIIYHNNFINNSGNAYDIGNNIWDDDYPSGGNYWDDYTGKDSNWDGIGDTPYPILGGDNEDRYPWMEPSGSKSKKIVAISGPLCPLLNIAEIDLIDGNSSQIKKIERILNNRILHFILPVSSIDVTRLNFSVSYNRKNPSPFFLYLRFGHSTVITENGNNTFYNETHTVTVKGLDGVFSFMRWKLRRLIPARFVFYGEYDEVMIEYPNGV